MSKFSALPISSSGAIDVGVNIPTVPIPTILVVDDYLDSLQVWDMYLRTMGFDVLTATDGAGALERAIEHRPDVVVLDLELPDVSGLEVARALRTHERTRHIPLIAATGYSQVEQLDAARRAGFDAVLLKPCEPQLLVTEIRRLLVACTPS